MRKHLTILMTVVLVIISASSSYAEPTKVYGNIDYEGTQLLSSPNGKAIGNLKYGDIVEYTPADAKFIKVRNIATGAEGFVKAIKINEAQYPLDAPELEKTENTDPFLLNIETEAGGETIEGWSFWKDGNGVKAFHMIRLVYNNGRSTTIEHIYKGEAKPGYLLLTEEVQYGEKAARKLETPIVIYEDIAGRAGVFVDGKCFTPNGQVGGSDTDDWD